MNRNAGAEPLAKPRSSAAPLPWVMEEMRDTGARTNPGQRPFTKSRVLPVLPVGVSMLRNSRVCIHDPQQQCEYDDYPHTGDQCKLSAVRPRNGRDCSLIGFPGIGIGL
jgi:hypothetical protein